MDMVELGGPVLHPQAEMDDPLMLLDQGGDHPGQPLIPASSRDIGVERVIRLAIGIVRRGIPGSVAGLNLGLKRAQDLGIDAARGKTRGLDLQQQAELKDLANILERDRRHDIAQSPARQHKFLLPQPPQGMADRGLSQAKALNQHAFGNLRTRGEAAEEDLVFQKRIGLIIEAGALTRARYHDR